MPPPVISFPVRDLEQHLSHNEKGRGRKGFDGELEKCELVSLLQYRCLAAGRPKEVGWKVECWPVERWFRRCEEMRLDKEGKGMSAKFMVETTAWEDLKEGV